MPPLRSCPSVGRAPPSRRRSAAGLPAWRRGRALPVAGLALLALLLAVALAAPAAPTAYAQEAPAPAASAAPAESPATPTGAPSENGRRTAPPTVETAPGWGWLVDVLWSVVDAALGAYWARVSEELRRELGRFWELGLWEYATRLGTRLVWAFLWVVITFWDAAFTRLCCADWKVLQYTAPQLTYASPAVQSLYGTLRGAANLAVATVVLAGGIGVIVRRHLGDPLPGATELLPRIIVAVLLANTALVWGGWLIDLNNALCRAVEVGTPFPRWGEQALLDRLAMEAVAYVVSLAMGVLLLFQNLCRLAVIDLLLAVSPLALLCWALPLTEGWARLWTATFGRAVFTQFVQVVLLKLGAGVAGAWAVGLDEGTRGLGGALLWIALLWVTFRVPALLRAGTDVRLGLVGALAVRGATRRLR
jgi:hypothetical protein